MKYLYPERHFTYSVMLRPFKGSCSKVILLLIKAGDIVSWEVWLGRHIDEKVASVPKLSSGRTETCHRPEREKLNRF